MHSLVKLSISPTEFGISLIQLKTTNNKVENVENAIALIRETVKVHKPRLVALPECFNAPYEEELFNQYAEFIPDGPTSVRLSRIAKELNIYLLGGSIPERDTENPETLYNTATVWSPEGELIAKHRKVFHAICFIYFSINHMKCYAVLYCMMGTCFFVSKCHFLSSFTRSIYLTLILKMFTNSRNRRC